MTCRSWRFAPGAAAWVKVGKNAHLSVWPGASGWCLKWYYWLVFFCWFKAGPSAGAFFPGICDSIWALSIYRPNEHLLLSVWGICVIVFYCIPDASESCCAVAAGKKNQQLLSIQSFRRQCAPELIWQKKKFLQNSDCNWSFNVWFDPTDSVFFFKEAINDKFELSPPRVLSVLCSFHHQMRALGIICAQP